ncbi:MAG TPA: hypothetical protein PLD54_02275 [Candidatus Levybacteria bacterium]|nr:hypothetical protein [Candidatus Levybacteria bacterium]
MNQLEIPIPEVSKVIQRFGNIPYVHERGPWLYPEGHPGDLTEGINCQMFFQEYLQAVTGFQIPREILSKEIFDDDSLFHNIPTSDLSTLQTGDVFLFGRNIPTDLLDSRSLHLAGFSHYDSDSNEPILIHFLGNKKNENDNGEPIQTKVGARTWPLSKFQNPKYREKYGKLWGVKRLSPESLINSETILTPGIETILSYFDKDKNN